MGKKNSNPESAMHNPTEMELPPVPEGYEDMAGDIIGYWDPDLTLQVHVIPKEAKVFDNSEEPKRASILIFATLVDSAIVRGKDDSGNAVQVEGKPGDMIGIWGKPGMRKALFNLAGQDCFICPAGELDTGKVNPMKKFSVRAKQRGKRLPLVEDRRDKSRNAATWWHSENGELLSSDADDDVPFSIQ